MYRLRYFIFVSFNVYRVARVSMIFVKPQTTTLDAYHSVKAYFMRWLHATD